MLELNTPKCHISEFLSQMFCLGIRLHTFKKVLFFLFFLIIINFFYVIGGLVLCLFDDLVRCLFDDLVSYQWFHIVEITT